MTALAKKIDYALISLAFLAERDGQWVSARQIASANDLPLQALMQILKTLNQSQVLRSTRGSKGGYQIARDLDALSLHELSEIMKQDSSPDEEPAPCSGPLTNIRLKLDQFLRNVRVSEVVTPGRRIDVPLSRLRMANV